MSLNKLLTGALLVQLIIVGTLIIAPAQTRTQPAAAAFDHSQCQYPSRTTNPPNGCDNSDPANPYCAVKGLPEDCQEPEPVQPTPKPKPAQPQVAQCGGK